MMITLTFTETCGHHLDPVVVTTRVHGIPRSTQIYCPQCQAPWRRVHDEELAATEFTEERGWLNRKDGCMPEDIKIPEDRTPETLRLLIADVQAERDAHGRSETGRAYSVAVTHLETALLWIQRARHIQYLADADALNS